VSLSTRWHRLDAAAWVHRLLVLQAVLLGLVTIGVFFLGAIAGMVWVTLIPAGLTVLTGWLAHAWDAGRERWTWWTVMTLGVLAAAADLLRLASGMSVLTLLHVLADAALLALLIHPDCSARLGRPSGPRSATRTPGGGGPSVSRP
jgi:hypothetical protein